MVDPFYQKSPVQGPAQAPVQTSAQAPQVQTPVQVNPVVQQQQLQLQIQQLNQQQTLLQQQYAQLNSYFQNPQATAAQKQQIQAQMQQLNTQYQQNAQLLQNLGAGANHVTKPTDAQIKKSGSKISIKGILIGCAILFVFLVAGFVGVFYYLMQNPGQGTSVGLDPATTKTLLQTFTTIFFGLVVFAGIALVIVNLYRRVTVKNKSKVGYVLGTVLGFILFIGALALGSNALTSIGKMASGNSLDATKMVIPYVFKVGDTATPWIPLQSDPNIKLIAPASISYVLNSTYFNSQLVASLSGSQLTLTDIKLSCGNGQTLSINMSTSQFVGSCMYLKKGSYPLGLLVSYTTVPSGAKNQVNFSGGTIVFQSEIALASNQGSLTYNDTQTEMIVGKVPAKVTFDAGAVFRDFNLPDYKVLWDINGDGQMDRQDASSFVYMYTGAKLYTVNVSFPGLNNYIYTFPLRVEQSDVPVCRISSTSLAATKYSFSTSFYDSTAIINQYEFSVLDQKNQGNVVDTVKNTNGAFEYQFPGAGTYAVRAVFLTQDGKQGTCESDDITVGAGDFALTYDLKYKSPLSPAYKSFGGETGVSFSSGIVSIKEVPTILQLTLSSVSPDGPSVVKQILLDGTPILSSDGKTFEIKIDTNADHQITILIQDATRGIKTQQTLTVKVNREDIIGKLVVKPGTVGTDPFTVTFDASTTVVNDPTDEIVYFSRDFGDGEVKKNLSQSIISHTYIYDQAKQLGEYIPVLTMQTKKGRIISISPDTHIIVKQALVSLKIHSDSHPAQLANVGDRVSLLLEINGVPSKIAWDFGNGKTLECAGRQCIQTITTYDTPGNYVIKVQVTYPNQPVVEGSITFKVK